MTTPISDVADPFGAPAPRAERGYGKGKPYIDRDGIRRDRWDRPILPDPRTGEDRAWTSVTTLAGTLDDPYALAQWKMRQVARGMGIRHDLAALAASVDMTDESGARARLQGIAADAMEAAGSSVGRNLGTAVHAATEEFDRASLGERVAIVQRARPDIAASLKAYAQTLDAHGLTVRPDLIERMTVCLATESAGTFDRFVEARDGSLMVFDVKSGQNANEYGYYTVAQQFAQYANGAALWRVIDRDTGQGVWEAFPENVRRDVGVLCWLPAGQAHCELFFVNLAEGMAEAKVAANVRRRRKEAKNWVIPFPPPAPAVVPGAVVNAVLTAPNEAEQAAAEADAYDRDQAFEVNPRQAYVDSGHAGCIECRAPNEDPAPWCDCRPGEECPQERSCRQRAHRPNECMEAGGRLHWLAARDQNRHDAVTATEPDHMVEAARELAERHVAGAKEALDALLIRRIAGAESRAMLMAMSKQHAAVWTADMQAAAAKRWTELPD